MKSMTGFGAGRTRLGPAGSGGRLTVELKSVNQRHLDLRVLLPKEYFPWEADLRKAVQTVVARGRIEMSVTRTAGRDTSPRFEVDVELARRYVEEWQGLKRSLRLDGEVDLSFLRGMTDLFRPTEPESRPESELPALRKALGDALRQLDAARRREGKHLERDMRARTRALDRLAAKMAKRARVALEATRERVAGRMRELLEGNADEGRVLQEAAFQAERGDVTEEIVRLRSHLTGLRELFDSSDPVGKRIDFLLQEVQREVNTTASKTTDLELTRLAVEAKGEIEKIREQVQNVE